MDKKFRAHEPALPSHIIRINSRLETAQSNPPRELLDDEVFYPRTPVDDAQDRVFFLRSQYDDMA